MGSLQAESDLKNELNDSGFAQDEPIKKQPLDSEDKPELLDLSDDVLLYILKYCDPRDLKALGFTCSRLGALVLDRTLWEKVDARSSPVGPQRLRWFLRNALTPNTTELLLSGYAREAEGCLGHMNCEFKDIDKQDKPISFGHWVNGHTERDEPPTCGVIRGGPVIQIYDTMPSPQQRATCFPLREAFGAESAPEWAPPDSSCPGPQYTFTPELLRELVTLCPAITSLGLEYCNIDCSTRNISNFPRTLKKLSLRGSRCYNQPVDKSFLFRIQDYLTKLEELNVSECNWIEPSSLLPLSKLPSLRRLYMRQCCKMTECVAYSSLATRYGFKKLQVIDLRESPVGDSEVSSFGWVATLEELYVSPAPFTPKIVNHAHYVGDDLPHHIELDSWEEEEPDYFKKQPKPKIEESKTKPKVVSEPQTLKRKMDVKFLTWADTVSPEVAAKKPKAVNDGAGTSKWTPGRSGPSKGASDPRTMDLDMGATPVPVSTVGADSETLTSKSERKLSEDVKAGPNLLGSDGPGTSEAQIGLPGGSRSWDGQVPLQPLHSWSQISKFKDSGLPRPSTSNGFPGPSNSGKVSPPSTPNNNSPGSKAEDTPAPSTSKSDSPPRASGSSNASSSPGPSDHGPEAGRISFQRYIRFRQNQSPVVVDRPEENVDFRNHEPLHKILYVNVGRRLHTMYRLTMPVYAYEDQDMLGMNGRRLDFPYITPRYDPRTLVTDSTVHRFGRGDSDNISYINIGPHGIEQETPGARPDRSNLRVLSLSGFRTITNRSLVHLATAAPMLRVIDFTGTRVTERGVANFRALRPDCEVHYD